MEFAVRYGPWPLIASGPRAWTRALAGPALDRRSPGATKADSRPWSGVRDGVSRRQSDVMPVCGWVCITGAAVRRRSPILGEARGNLGQEGDRRGRRVGDGAGKC